MQKTAYQALLTKQINEAPEPLRTYVMDVETTCPEASVYLYIRELEDTNAALQILVEELHRSLLTVEIAARIAVGGAENHFNEHPGSICFIPLAKWLAQT